MKILHVLFGVLLIFQLQAQSFQSSNLPIVVIQTNGSTIVDEPKIMVDMGIIYNGAGNRNSLTDPFTDYDGKVGIEIRGSSSQMFPKKQYGLELWLENGDDQDAALLGLPAESDWILSAPYNDKTLMRDVLAYKLGRDMGRYAPRTFYVELVLNGQYQGVYFLNEKIKRDRNRVDIAGLNPDEISGDDLTGGYIIKVDKTEGDSGPGFDSQYAPPGRSGDQKITFQYEYPKWDDIVTEQKAYIKNFMDAFENALNGDDFKDPETGYAQYIDVDSFVDYFIMNEVTKNVDGYRLSTFMYKEKDSDGGKLAMGPIWDFNLGFGNVDYCTNGWPEGFVLDFNTTCPTDFWLIPFWWDRLFLDPAFRQKVSDRWFELRGSTFSTASIHAYIDSVAGVLNQEAQQRNFQRWPVMGEYIWPNYYVGGSFQSEVGWLKGWVSDRMNWLDENIPVLVTEVSGSPEKGLVSAYPNPFHNKIGFEYSIHSSNTISIQITDLSGKVIDGIYLMHERPGTFHQELGEQLIPGMYLYTFQIHGKEIRRGKLVKR